MTDIIRTSSIVATEQVSNGPSIYSVLLHLATAFPRLNIRGAMEPKIASVVCD